MKREFFSSIRYEYQTTVPLINAGLLVAMLCERPYFSTYIYTYLHTYLPIYIPPYPSTS